MGVCVCLLYDTSSAPNILAAGKLEISDAKFASQIASSFSLVRRVSRGSPRLARSFTIFAAIRRIL